MALKDSKRKVDCPMRRPRLSMTVDLVGTTLLVACTDSDERLLAHPVLISDGAVAGE